MGMQRHHCKVDTERQDKGERKNERTGPLHEVISQDKEEWTSK